MWLPILGLLNLALFFITIFFLLEKKDRQKIYGNLPKIFSLINQNILPILVIAGVVIFHLIEVRFIYPIVTSYVGYDYANVLLEFEDGIVYWFSQNWILSLVYFFVIVYIGIYPFTLWFTPFYAILTNDKKAINTLAYGLLLIYLIALPFYLFLPITNVYTFYNASSALESVIPGVESFFYSTTTLNNCLPSLHTAMTILIAYTTSRTGNKKLTYFTIFVMISVIISVIYLSIHWLTDVLTGVLLSAGVIFILKRFKPGECNK